MPKGTMSKTIVRSVDLDEIERQLREIAKSAAQNQSKSRGVGRLDPHFAKEVPAPQALPQSDGRAARFLLDAVAEVPHQDAAERSPTRRRLRALLMVAVPVLAIACGVGAVMAMRPNINVGSILGSSVTATSGDTAASPPTANASMTPAPSAASKPAEQAAKAGADGQGGAKPQTAQGEALLPALPSMTAPAVSAPTPVALAPSTPAASPQAASAPTALTLATATPAAAPAKASVADVPQAAAQAAMFGKPRRVATISIKPEADAPAPAADPSQAAADAALFGTPRRVTSFSVKPDGSFVPSQGGASQGGPNQASAPAPAPRVASTDAKAQPAPAPSQGTPTPPAKPHADVPRPKPKPAPTANRRQTGQAALSIHPPGGVAAPPQDAPPQVTESATQSARSNPLGGVANGFRRVLEITHIVGPTTDSGSQ